MRVNPITTQFVMGFLLFLHFTIKYIEKNLI